MPIVFAAITPHPPLLIPAIGKEKASLVEKTHASFLRLEEALYISKPQVIVIISPHTSLFPDAFTVNGHTTFATAFQEFGDMVTTQSWHGAPELAALVSHHAKKFHLPVQVVSQEALDHGATIPLFFLTEHLPDVKILPVGYSNLSREEHVRFGNLLKEALLDANKRVAVIASGDLSHTEPGRTFDEALLRALKANDVQSILSIPEGTVTAAKECGYRSILIALGMLEHMHTTFSAYSYETPVDIGYAVGNFHL